MPEYLANILAAAVVIGLAYSIATKNWWVVLTAFNIDMIVTLIFREGISGALPPIAILILIETGIYYLIRWSKRRNANLQYRYTWTAYADATGYSSQEVKNGYVQDYQMYKDLDDLPGEKRFLFNCYINNEKADLVLIHDSGIYVIDRDTHKGYLKGTDQEETWEQTLPLSDGSTEHNIFISPVRINETHLEGIDLYLEKHKKANLFGIVTFPDDSYIEQVSVKGTAQYFCREEDLFTLILDISDAVDKEHRIGKGEIEAVTDCLKVLQEIPTEEKLEAIR